MEASALAEASQRGLLARSSPLLRLASDERLVELIRARHERAFEVLFERYRPRLLAFCRNMLPSQEDAEDILQDVFIAAHQAMIADERAIHVKPWLYRIARNRCLNHLRRQTADGQDSMDEFIGANGASVAQQVEDREEFRHLVRDVRDLPETQRTALLLREIEGLSYDEIARSMDTTIPAVKSLLVRARVTLAESTQARRLTCSEVRLELAEAAEGLAKLDGVARQHMRRCEPCREFRDQLNDDARALQAAFGLPLLALAKGLLISKLGLGGSGAATAGGGAATGTAATGAASVGGVAAGGALASGGGAAIGGGGLGGLITGAIGAKAAAGMATAALLTAGAAEVNHVVNRDGPESNPPARSQVEPVPPPTRDVASTNHHKAKAATETPKHKTTAVERTRDRQKKQDRVPEEPAPAVTVQAPSDSGGLKPRTTETTSETTTAEPVQPTTATAPTAPTSGTTGGTGSTGTTTSGTGTTSGSGTSGTGSSGSGSTSGNTSAGSSSTTQPTQSSGG